MATRIKDEKGSVLWGPNTFGSYTIEQIQVVTKIFEDLLKNLSLKVENVGENVHKDVYTKEESNTLFILKTDFNSLASDLVKALVNNYIQEQASTAGLAAAADVRTLEKVIIPLREMLGNYNANSSDTKLHTIIPLREMLGNYNRYLSYSILSSIIPLREMLGNYNLSQILYL